ncbi:MAG: ATP--guanido phosphotransferase, partial [Planctomycetaceae bacterium]
MLDLNNLIERRGEWLRGTGTDADIVMSSRIRLARNLAQFPFLNRADDTVRAEIERTLRRHVTELSLGGPRSYVDVGHLERLDRQFLVERQLISRELSESHGSRG